MEKEYNMTFYLAELMIMIECRQTKQKSLSIVVKEAELYKAWLEVHYGTKISYNIK